MATKFAFYAQRFSKYYETRKSYESLIDWLKVIYNQLLLSTSLQHLRLPGRDKVWNIKLRGLDEKFYARGGSTDLLVLEEIFIREDYGCCRGFLELPPKLIIDLGANVGYSIRYWLKHYKTVSVIAVEPDVSNCEMIQHNVDIEHHNVTIVQAAVSSKCGHLFIGGEDRLAWGKKVAWSQPESNSTLVKSLTINKLLEITGITGQKIDLLKCDIEGSEADIFQDCSSWINSVQNLVIEIHGDFTISLVSLVIRQSVASETMG